MRDCRSTIPCLFLPLFLVGCGYRFTAGGAPLPEGIRSVEVPIFANKTAEPGLETIFTDAMRLQIVRAGLSNIRPADAEIQGEILAVSGGPTLVTAGGLLASYRLAATAHVRLVKNGRTVVDAQVGAAEDYLPGVDVVESEANRGAALQRLAQTLARDAYDRLTTGW
jgi:lipopolysaccharide assembly LptE-like protein